MKKQILLSGLVLTAVLMFSIPWAWAEGQDAGQGENQCLHADQANHQCVHSEKSEQTADDKDSAGLEKPLASYFAILSSLSQDSMENVQENAQDLAETMSRLAKHCTENTEGCDKSCRPGLLADASAASKALADANDIGTARSQFGVISEKLVEFLKNNHDGPPSDLHIYRCDMAQKVWLQENEEPGNPYLGPSMAKCKRKIN